MPYLRRLPSGKWQATVRGPDGRKHTFTHPLKSVTRAWAAEQESSRARGAFKDPRAGQVTVAVWHEKWWRARVVEPETKRGDASVVGKHLLPYWGGWQLADIGRLDVQAWVARMETDGVGRSAIARAYNLFATMLGAAVEEDVIGRSPCRKITLPTIPKRPPFFFTREEVAAVLGQLGEPWRTLVLLKVYTGMRWGEIAGLKIERIDWSRSRLHVVGVMTRRGWKPYPKSKKSYRELSLPPHVLAALARHVGDRDAGLVFTTVTPGREGRDLSDANFRKYVWYPALDRARLCTCPPSCGKQECRDRRFRDTPDLCRDAEHVSEHDCRHTCASWLVMAGVDLYRVQQQLGHESYTTTMRYAHLAPDFHDVIQEAWDEIGEPIEIRPAGARVAHEPPQDGTDDEETGT
jgi:integrase